MKDEALCACLGHLAASERLLEDAADWKSLARLALVIDMLLRTNGLPDRDIQVSWLDPPPQ